MFLAADLIFCHGSNFISRAIRWATRARGEAPTYANHVAGFINPSDIVEALWHVEQSPYRVAVPEPHQVWRLTALTDYDRFMIARAAKSYVGRHYGPIKNLAHLADGLLGKVAGTDVHLFRRLNGMDRYPICSWVWAYAYDKAQGYRFGMDPAFATPDCMHDWVRTAPAWEMVYEQGVAA